MQANQRICEKANEYGGWVYEVLLPAADVSATTEDMRSSATKLHAIARRLTALSDDLWLVAERIDKEEGKYK